MADLLSGPLALLKHSLVSALSGRPLECPATDNVNMKMKDRLPSFCSVVNYRSKPVESFLFCDLCCGEEEVTEERLVRLTRLVEARELFSRDNEDMSRCDGVDVSERDAAFIFVDDLSRELPGDNPCEKGGHDHLQERPSSRCPLVGGLCR